MEKAELLKNATEHCFFVEHNDSGAQLCRANIPYGIAQIHHLQKSLGYEPDATFITTPDMTVSRNISRWRDGYGYGGKITYGDGNLELVVLNIKPNACGMLVGGLESLPEVEEVVGNMEAISGEGHEIDGYKVEWDFHKSNHFINILKVDAATVSSVDLPPYIFIIHGSSPEFRAENEMGFGIYHDKSESLQKMMQTMDGPFGKIYYLTGDDAKRFYDKYVMVDDFTKKKRSLAGKLLFGDYREISNETHQGMHNINEVLLGCHHISPGGIYPITFRADLPAYLVRGRPNFTPDMIESLGFAMRAQRIGVYDRLLKADIIPHGGGYTFPDILGVNRVMEFGNSRYFEVEMGDGMGKQVVLDVKELPFEYRGRSVMMRALELGMVDIAAKLTPQYIIKI